MNNLKSHPAEKEAELLPCPFCGSENVCVDPLVGGFVVDCQDCGGGCGTCHSEGAAREEWNKRKSLTENPQPTYADVWDAFVSGANEASQNPKAGEKQFNLAADGYCKFIHAQKAPGMFEAMSSPNRE